MDKVRLQLFAMLAFGVGCAIAAPVRVLAPDGNAASGARAIPMAMGGPILIIKSGEVDGIPDQTIVEVDPVGVLQVGEAKLGRWIVLHPDGWADLTIAADTRELRLQPWHSVSGTARVPDAAGAKLIGARVDPVIDFREGRSVWWWDEAKVGADGSFTLRRLPAGRTTLCILRERAVESRVIRWPEYPLSVHVPQNEGQAPELRAEGREVTGVLHLGKEALPAAVALIPADPAKPAGPHEFRGLSEEDGRFAIPGVAPGDYWFIARALREAIPNGTILREVSVAEGADPLCLGGMALPADGPEIEIYRYVQCHENLPGRVIAYARSISPQPIQKLWLGQLGHPSSVYGTRITFLPEPHPSDPTRATVRTLLADIPWKSVRAFYPEQSRETFAVRFLDGEFKELRRVDTEVRIFRLDGLTLHILLRGVLDYGTASRLLAAIQGRALRSTRSSVTRANPWGAGEGVYGGSFPPEQLPRIDVMSREQAGGTIRVGVPGQPFSGTNYEFAEDPDGFRLVGACYWKS